MAQNLSFNELLPNLIDLLSSYTIKASLVL